MKSMLRRRGSATGRTILGRFAYGIAWGCLGALGMWLISTLSHAEKAGLGLTWQVAVTFVLMTGIISLSATPRTSTAGKG
jgi:hypothetical protein